MWFYLTSQNRNSSKCLFCSVHSLTCHSCCADDASILLPLLLYSANSKSNPKQRPPTGLVSRAESEPGVDSEPPFSPRSASDRDTHLNPPKIAVMDALSESLMVCIHFLHPFFGAYHVTMYCNIFCDLILPIFFAGRRP